MDFQEILKELINQDITGEMFGCGDMPKILPNIGMWEEKENKGGEGEGDHRHVVYFFEDHDVFIKLDGYYTSYDGTSWDSMSEAYAVLPQQEVITVYKAV